MLTNSLRLHSSRGFRGAPRQYRLIAIIKLDAPLLHMYPFRDTGKCLAAACSSERAPMDSATQNEFATKYTAAWCSHNTSCDAADYLRRLNAGTKGS